MIHMLVAEAYDELVFQVGVKGVTGGESRSLGINIEIFITILRIQKITLMMK